MNLVTRAYNFAKQKHDATGKLYNNKPYFVHPVLVYHIVRGVERDDNNLLAAAYLHDILEDTNTTYEELAMEFNDDVASLVQEVTKDKKKDFPNLKTARGLILKVADRLANVASLNAIIDPERFDKLFKKYSFCFIHEGSHLHGK